MSEVNYTIVAHPDRMEWVSDLYYQLGDPDISYDRDGIGCARNHLKAWWTSYEFRDPDAEWIVIIEDDVILVQNFVHEARDALLHAPSPLVSFYLGTGRPISIQERLPGAFKRAKRANAHWLGASYMHHAPAIALEVGLVSSMLAYCDKFPDQPPDERISYWARQEGVRISYSVPSLVDHRDEYSLAQKNIDHVSRHAYRFGAPTTWNNTWVPL